MNTADEIMFLELFIPILGIWALIGIGFELSQIKRILRGKKK